MDGAQKGTPEKGWGRLKAFLASLRLTGCVSEALTAAGVSRTWAYKARRTRRAFAAAWEDALAEATDRLVREARRRAYEGADEPVIYKGELRGVWVDADGRVVSAETPGARLIPLTVKKYSDVLLMFLIKARRPEYRENFKVEHTGDPAKPVTLDCRGQALHDHHLDREALCEFAADLAAAGLGPVPPHGPPQPLDAADPLPQAAALPPAH
jgi:hypothetical protein